MESVTRGFKLECTRPELMAFPNLATLMDVVLKCPRFISRRSEVGTLLVGKQNKIEFKGERIVGRWRKMKDLWKRKGRSEKESEGGDRDGGKMGKNQINRYQSSQKC